MLEKLPDAIGRALENQRAGMDKVLFNQEGLGAHLSLLRLYSPAFAPESELPRRYTADGAGLSPPLRWSDVPPNTASLVLIVEDADSPTPVPLVHGIVVDIDPHEVGLAEGIFSEAAKNTPEKLGLNSFLMHGWLPPDPPPGHGTHRYVFQLFALATGEPLSRSPGRREVAAAVRERAVAKGQVIGTYARDVTIKLEGESAEPANVAAMADSVPAA